MEELGLGCGSFGRDVEEAHMDAMLDEEALGELEERGDVAMPGLGRTARNAWFIAFCFSYYHGFYSLAYAGYYQGHPDESGVIIDYLILIVILLLINMNYIEFFF